MSSNNSAPTIRKQHCEIHDSPYCYIGNGYCCQYCYKVLLGLLFDEQRATRLPFQQDKEKSRA